MDFIWINRDQSSFEWFVNLLDCLEKEQTMRKAGKDNFLQFHLYFTQAQRKNDIKGLTLQVAMDLLHKQVK